MNAEQLAEIKSKNELTTNEKRAVHESLTESQQEGVLWLSYGCTGIAPSSQKPGVWIVYDTATAWEYDFDPRKLLGPITAYEIPRVEDL